MDGGLERQALASHSFGGWEVQDQGNIRSAETRFWFTDSGLFMIFPHGRNSTGAL